MSTLFLCLLASSRRPFCALKMRPVRQVLLLARHASENASRTREGCFWHRISLPYRRSLFFTPNASENASRTVGSLFEHGTHIPYHRRAFPVPSPQRQAAAAAELRTYKERGRPFSRPLVVLYRHEPRVWNAAQAVELRNRFEIILLQPEL